MHPQTIDRGPRTCTHTHTHPHFTRTPAIRARKTFPSPASHEIQFNSEPNKTIQRGRKKRQTKNNRNSRAAPEIFAQSFEVCHQKLTRLKRATYLIHRLHYPAGLAGLEICRMRGALPAATRLHTHFSPLGAQALEANRTN